MSLIESAIVGPAPLASEEKSLDKLEIEMEEKEHMIKDSEGDHKTEVPEPTDKSKKEQNGEESKTPRRPKLNIKIPQILRKRSKERPQEKEKGKKEKEKDEGEKTEKELLNKEETTVKDSKEAAVLEIDSSFVSVKELNEKDKPAEASFLASFSTPKWPNFRQVFSFNRSTPMTMAHDPKDTRLEPSEPATVTVDLSEDVLAKDYQPSGTPEKTLLSQNEDQNDKDEQKTTSTTEKPTSSSEKTIFAPFIRFFRPKITKEKDLESGEVATELLDKNNIQSEDNNGVNKTPQKSPAHPMEPDRVDGEAKISPTHETKGSEEAETKDVELKTGNGNGESIKEKDVEKDGVPTKPSAQVWRARLTRLPRLSKWILAGLCALIALLAVILSITAFRASRAIDIGSLIIDGKYINSLTSCGPIQGVLEDGGFAFRGIPYAVPPLGELRWKPAQIHHHLEHCWNGTYLAHNDSIPCWQFYRNGSYDGAEDCLHLSIFTPKVYYDTPLPVVVYIGGESLGGGQSSTLQPSAALARAKNVVFVSVSIRRSVLGFLALDVLSRNSYPMSSGNYGLSDLKAALQWVHYNVEHFGGDKNHVTLLGHQSGATLASALMSSHLEKTLFHQVWVSGGSPVSTLISFQDAEVQNAGFMKEIQCKTVECLYSKNPEELLEAVPYDWRGFYQDLPTKDEKKHHWLVRDGMILRDTPSGSNMNIQVEVPFVAGVPAEVDASQEMFSFLDWNSTSKFSAYLESKLGSFGTSLSREVSDRYFRPENTHWQQFASLLSDVRTICPLYYSTTFLANQYRSSRAYFYVVNQRKQSPIGFVADANSDIAAILGVYGAETREEKKYVKNMEKLFYGFVERGKFPDDHDVTKSIYLVNEDIQKTFTYPNCEFWHQHNFYPNYSRID